MSEKQRRPGRYPDEMREQAVRMVLDHQAEYPSPWRAIDSISKKLSITRETLRQWVRRAETDTGERPGPRQIDEFDIEVVVTPHHAFRSPDTLAVRRPW